jgi:hypothetical protein
VDGAPAIREFQDGKVGSILPEYKAVKEVCGSTVDQTYALVAGEYYLSCDDLREGAHQPEYTLIVERLLKYLSSYNEFWKPKKIKGITLEIDDFVYLPFGADANDYFNMGVKVPAYLGEIEDFDYRIDSPAQGVNGVFSRIMFRKVPCQISEVSLYKIQWIFAKEATPDNDLSDLQTDCYHLHAQYMAVSGACCPFLYSDTAPTDSCLMKCPDSGEIVSIDGTKRVILWSEEFSETIDIAKCPPEFADYKVGYCFTADTYRDRNDKVVKFDNVKLLSGALTDEEIKHLFDVMNGSRKRQ